VENLRNRVVEVLKQVYDPEIPINIYDLGLVYSIDIDDSRIRVVLGVTSPFCPLAHVLPRIVEDRLRQEFPDREIEVVLDLSKVWSPTMMTEEGRKKFKELFGYDPAARP